MIRFKEDIIKAKRNNIEAPKQKEMSINKTSLIIKYYQQGCSAQEIKLQVEGMLKQQVSMEYIYKIISIYRKETGTEQPSKGEQTREMVMHYLTMGVKQSVIAATLGITRSYVSLVKKDYVILEYIVQGTINDDRIARVLGITEREVIAVREKYKNYLHNSH